MGTAPRGALHGPGVSLAVFLLGMSALLNLYSTQPILTELSRWGQVDTTSAAWTISATTLGVAAFAPVAGSISDRVGRKRVILAAITAMAAATLFCAVAPSFESLLAFRLIHGLATPFVFTVAVAYIAEEAPGPLAARLNSLYVAGTAFGGFIGRLLAGFTFDVTGSWRLTFVGAAVVLLAPLAATAVWLPRETHFSPAPSVFAGLRGAGRYLCDWRILATCVVGAALLFQQVASFTFGSLHLLQPPFDLTPAQVGLVFIVFLAPTVLTPFVGRAVARTGTTTTFLATTTIGAVGLGLTLIPTTATVVVGLALSCIAVFAGQSCATGFIGRYAARDKSAAVGVYLTSYYLGGTLAGLLAGPVYVGLGWTGVVVLLLLVLALGGAAASTAWRRAAA